ncbi:MAG: hypothetical protein P8126_12100 [Gammaproteobacteria bacterium]
MERRLKERLIGAAVLVMLAVIFIPMILSDSNRTETAITKTNIPQRPEGEAPSHIAPLQESDLKSAGEEGAAPAPPSHHRPPRRSRPPPPRHHRPPRRRRRPRLHRRPPRRRHPNPSRPPRLPGSAGN